MSYRFEPQLSRASTIPSTYYNDPAVRSHENRSIFARTWQLAGHVEQVRERGQFFTTTIADEPLLIVRGDDNAVRALSNVCRHRAGPVAKGSGKRPALQCGYHGWTYALDGTLRTAPEMDGIECWDRQSIALPRFRIDSWNGLLFVNLDPAAPALLHFLGDLGARRFAGALAARKEWIINCNWKVYVDNYLEGHHIPIVQPGLFREIDYPNYPTETRRNYSIQHAPLKKPERIRAESKDDEAEYFWVYPNLMLNVYPDNFSTNLIVPIGHDRTLTLFEWYFRDPADPAVKDTVAFSDEIQIEDVAICEAVQRGLRSTTYSSGRYSPVRENGVH